MGRMRWAAYLWPGLPQLWRYGNAAGLILALGLAVLVDVAVLATFGWTELLSPTVRSSLWIGTGILWLISVVYAANWDGNPQKGSLPAAGIDHFGEALSYYLKGNWFEAERVLATLLELRPRDLDARLLLATLLRHTGRSGEAAEQLDRIEGQDGAWKWDLEIRRERQWLAQASTSAGDSQGSSAGAAPTAEQALPRQAA